MLVILAPGSLTLRSRMMFAYSTWATVPMFYTNVQERYLHLSIKVMLQLAQVAKKEVKHKILSMPVLEYSQAVLLTKFIKGE
jgi:hypothetical protein